VTIPFLDTDVLIRLLTGDDPVKQAQAAALFEAVEAGQLIVEAPVTVIADAVYVLSSKRLYNLNRGDVQALLTPIVRLPGFRLVHRQAVLRSLELFGSTRLDFGDCLIVALMEQRGSTTVFSYDTDFDRFPTIQRREPGALGHL
jgi:predicted nucleic acid-binding protein